MSLKRRIGFMWMMPPCVYVNTKKVNYEPRRHIDTKIRKEFGLKTKKPLNGASL
jgi:hypothetical protein